MLGIECYFGRSSKGDLIVGNILFDIDHGQCAPTGGARADVLQYSGRLDLAGGDRNLTYVPVDLEGRRLGDQLAACGFELDVRSFCSVLGVTQYLDRDAVDALFGFVAKLPKGSEIVFSFAPSDDQPGVTEGDASVAFGRRPAALGEPWKSWWRASDLVAQLTGLRYSDIFCLTPEMAQQRYFADQNEIRESRRWDHLIAAVV